MNERSVLTKDGITVWTSPENNKENRDALLTDDLINYMLSDGVTTNNNLMKLPLTRDNYIASIHDLYDKIEKVMNDELSFNVIDYLPKKKNGKLDPRKKPLLAVCPYGIFDNGYAPTHNTIVIQIEPESETSARLGLLYYFQIQPKPNIILQDINNPIDLSTTVRAKYLKQDTIKAGFIYENKNGKPYLYLGENTTNRWPHYNYVAYTKKLEKQLADNNLSNYDDFINYMETAGDKRPQLFSSTAPRKFVKELNCRLVNYTIAPDDIYRIFCSNS